MSFAVRLVTDIVQVEPGSTVPLALEIVNRTDEPDQYEVTIEGLDPSWVAVPVPVFPVEGRETHVERLFLKPPRESESLAGTYPFVVQVRSVVTGESKSAQGALEVRPYFSLSLDVAPKRTVIGSIAKQASFNVSVMNLGNADQTLQLFATDPEGVFAFEFEHDQVIVGAGQQREIAVSASASKKPLLANPRLQNFTVSARNTQNPALAAASTAQIEQKAVASPGAVALLFLTLVLAIGWYLLWPKPPVVESLTVSSEKVTAGTPVEISWQVDRAKSVSLTIGDWSQTRLPSKGTVTYVGTKPGRFTVDLKALSGSLVARDQTRVIQIDPAPIVPEPVIESISIEPKTVKPGEPFMLKYKFNSAVTRATLYPTQQPLDVRATEIQLRADKPGTLEYRVKAANDAGVEVERAVSVRVEKSSAARIVLFRATPGELPVGGGKVTVEWTAVDAARLELQYLGTVVALDSSSGTYILDLTASASLKLVAYDADALKTESKPVNVKVAEPPTDPGSTSGGAPTAVPGP
ncbi:MAG: hypothetical protein KF884_07940 [Fimbriimonadaceae bacterium]|nr:hypothetical protein [Fimbriimonadaceae bacterium]QYK57481.1 MAG: hypothetical protein KF884_07940 [Fimbriimonadaceae bacterium]